MKTKDSGIYYIKSKHNNKLYVGQSIDIQARWRKHTSKLKDNKHHSIHLQNHFNKYGIADLEFCILEIINQDDLSIEDYKKLLNSREQFYMDNLGNDFNCQPIAGTSLGYKHTEETKLKIRSAIVGKHTKDLKGYFYERNRWRVVIRINETRVRFGSYKTEQEAIDKVNLVLSKIEDNIDITKELIDSLKPVKIKAKNYYFNQNKNKWDVIITINSKLTYFGCYETELEAQIRVNEVLNGQDAG
jgi:group I intron endonuclease